MFRKRIQNSIGVLTGITGVGVLGFFADAGDVDETKGETGLLKIGEIGKMKSGTNGSNCTTLIRSVFSTEKMIVGYGDFDFLADGAT